MKGIAPDILHDLWTYGALWISYVFPWDDDLATKFEHKGLKVRRTILLGRLKVHGPANRILQVVSQID